MSFFFFLNIETNKLLPGKRVQRVFLSFPVRCLMKSASVFPGHSGRDRCPQWHLQECGWEQVQDGQGSGQLRGSCVSAAETGRHEPTLEWPEGQVGKHSVSPRLFSWVFFLEKTLKLTQVSKTMLLYFIHSISYVLCLNLQLISDVINPFVTHLFFLF